MATTPLPSVGSEAVSGLAPTATIPDSSGFPLEHGMSLSYWLQGVRASPLLNHRTTGDIPLQADVVIIGSGVCVSRSHLTGQLLMVAC